MSKHFDGISREKSGTELYDADMGRNSGMDWQGKTPSPVVMPYQGLPAPPKPASSYNIKRRGHDND